MCEWRGKEKERWVLQDTSLLETISDYGEIVTKAELYIEVADVSVFDDTFEATLALRGRIALSAADWNRSETILLLSDPDLRIGEKSTICIKPGTHVDVDPSMSEAIWLRNFAQRLTKNEHINQLFPEGGNNSLHI